MERNDQHIIGQAVAAGVKGGQALAGRGVIQANGQMVRLDQIALRKVTNILDDFARLPGDGGIMAAYGRTVSLAADKPIGRAEVDEDGVVGGEGGGGTPVEGEAGSRRWKIEDRR